MIERGASDTGSPKEGAECVAETSCAGGPVFRSGLRRDGSRISFSDAYPEAPKWVKRLAAWVGCGSVEP